MQKEIAINAVNKSIEEIVDLHVALSGDYNWRQRFLDLGDDEGNYVGNLLSKAHEDLNRAKTIIEMYR